MSKKKQAMTREQAIDKVTAFYDQSAFVGKFAHLEPTERPSMYGCLGELETDQLVAMAGAIGKTDMRAVDPIFGPRPTQDGIKIGTSTWVFMGRRAAENAGLVKVCPSQPNLVATGRVLPPGFGRKGVPLRTGAVIWCLWRTDDGGALLADRVPGSEADINEILSDPEGFGLRASRHTTSA